MIIVHSWYYKSGKQGFEVWLMGKSQLLLGSEWAHSCVSRPGVYGGSSDIVSPLP